MDQHTSCRKISMKGAETVRRFSGKMGTIEAP
jgi:hypothetical protein